MLTSGWGVGVQTWRYHPRDPNVHSPEPSYYYWESTATMSTWVLEGGSLSHDGSIDGKDFSFAGDYDVVLHTLMRIAQRNGIEVPWNAQE